MRKYITIILLFIVFVGVTISYVNKVNKLNENNPWYKFEDQDMQQLSSAFIINAREKPHINWHPGVGTKIIYGFYFQVLKVFNITPVANYKDFDKSEDPAILWPKIIGHARILSIILTIIYSFIIGLIAWKLTDYIIMLPVGFLMATTSYGIMIHSLMVRTELIASIFGTSSFLFIILSLKTDKLWKYTLYSILSGVCFPLAIYTKVHAYPFIVIVVFWFLFMGIAKQENAGQPKINENLEFSLSSSNKLYDWNINGNISTIYYYFIRLLPSICITIFSFFNIFILSRWFGYYIPIFITLFILTPTYVFMSKKYPSNIFFSKLEYIINFFSGIFLGLVAPLYIYILKLGSFKAIEHYAKDLMWFITHPMITYNAYSVKKVPYGSINKTIIFFVSHYIDILLFFIPFIIMFLIMFILKKNKSKKIGFFILLLIAIAFAYFSTFRQGIYKNYFIFTDAFFILAIIVSFSNIIEYFSYISKYILLFLFLVSIALNGTYQHNNLKRSYTTRIKHYENHKMKTVCFSHDYGDQYNNLIRKKYKSSKQCIDRVGKFLSIPDNHYTTN